MGSMETKFLCEDAAAAIAELIDEENMHLQHALGQNNPRKRDIHRAETGIRALKEALRIVLLEQACRRSNGRSQLMPDVEAYLATRAPAA